MLELQQCAAAVIEGGLPAALELNSTCETRIAEYVCCRECAFDVLATGTIDDLDHLVLPRPNS